MHHCWLPQADYSDLPRRVRRRVQPPGAARSASRAASHAALPRASPAASSPAPDIGRQNPAAAVSRGAARVLHSAGGHPAQAPAFRAVDPGTLHGFVTESDHDERVTARSVNDLPLCGCTQGLLPAVLKGWCLDGKPVSGNWKGGNLRQCLLLLQKGRLSFM